MIIFSAGGAIFYPGPKKNQTNDESVSSQTWRLWEKHWENYRKVLFLDIQQVDQAWSQDHFPATRLKKFYFAVMQYHFEDPWEGGGRIQNSRKFPGNFRKILGKFSEKSQKIPGNFPTPRGVDNMCGGVSPPPGVLVICRGVCEHPPGTSDSIFSKCQLHSNYPGFSHTLQIIT